jgi:hypothetical protein
MEAEGLVPGHIVHFYVDRKLFGKVFYKVHRAIDKPIVFVGGKNHRKYNHDMASCAFLASKTYSGDPRAVQSAYVHILTDQICTNSPYFKKMLEQMAYADKARRKQARKNASQQKTPKVVRRIQ